MADDSASVKVGSHERDGRGSPVSRDGGFAEALLATMGEALYCVDRDRTITYWNSAAERLTGFAAADVVGQRCRDNVLNHVDEDGRSLCKTRCPLLGTMRDGAPHEAHVYLHHHDGHRVAVEVRAAALRDAQNRISGAVEVFHDDTRARDFAREAAQAAAEALTDPLTGLANRRQLERSLLGRMDDLSRYGHGFGVLFLDVDHFKQVNDSYGHDAGDAVLRMVAATLRSSIRGTDLVGRWGGEEFLVLAPVTQPTEARRLAERMRRIVATTYTHLDGHRVGPTVSVGVTVARVDEPLAELVDRADTAMIAAKQSGRNRVHVG